MATLAATSEGAGPEVPGALAGAAHERMVGRYHLRDRLQGLSSIDRVRVCGKFVIDGDRGVEVRYSEDGRPYFGNVQSCASVHACPVCAPKIRQGRAQEVGEGLGRWIEAGKGAVMLTVTIPHHVPSVEHPEMRLEPLLASIGKAYRALWSGRKWQDQGEALGYVGQIKALEVDHGPNGWHPHYHSALFFDQPLDQVDLLLLRIYVYERWKVLIERAGYSMPTWEGVHVAPVRSAGDVADYCTKSVGLELARHDLKAKRRDRPDFGLRSAWSIARDLADGGEVADLVLWTEYEQATAGKRAMVWSRGLRTRLDLLEREASDEQLADLEVGGELAITIGKATWAAIVNRRLRSVVLQIGFDHGPDGLGEWLGRLENDIYAGPG